MAEGVQVDSIEVLRAFKTAIWKFQESATVALGDSESEVQRVLVWLENEQDSYWQGQIRKRQEAVARAKEAVRMKKVFKDSAGRSQTAIEEEKNLQQAVRKLQEAEQKLLATRKWSRVLQKEMEMYKGAVQRFATSVQSELPNAAHYLEALASKLDAYVAVQGAGYGGGGAGPGMAGGPQEPSMGRAAMTMPAGSPQEVAQLREQIPSAKARAAAAVVHEFSLAVPAVPDEQRGAIAPLADRGAPGEGKVFVSPAASASQRIFLHRAEPSSPDDTGWSVAAPGAAADGDWNAVAVTEFLKARPDLQDLLALPAGFSVIIDAGGIVAVTDPQQQTAWRRAE